MFPFFCFSFESYPDLSCLVLLYPWIFFTVFVVCYLSGNNWFIFPFLPPDSNHYLLCAIVQILSFSVLIHPNSTVMSTITLFMLTLSEKNSVSYSSVLMLLLLPCYTIYNHRSVITLHHYPFILRDSTLQLRKFAILESSVIDPDRITQLTRIRSSGNRIEKN